MNGFYVFRNHRPVCISRILKHSKFPMVLCCDCHHLSPYSRAASSLLRVWWSPQTSPWRIPWDRVGPQGWFWFIEMVVFYSLIQNNASSHPVPFLPFFTNMKLPCRILGVCFFCWNHATQLSSISPYFSALVPLSPRCSAWHCSPHGGVCAAAAGSQCAGCRAPGTGSTGSTWGDQGTALPEIWGFPKMGDPHFSCLAGWFILENPFKHDSGWFSPLNNDWWMSMSVHFTHWHWH